MADLGARDWIRPRRGLGRVGARLRAADERIAYLGASVTVQREGFRPILHEQLVDTFGRPHKAVNAGVGAVGSVSAVFLMDALVLSSPVALCFIEYTTGDWGGKTALADVGPSVEGIVRKLAAQGSAACILHLWREDQSNSWRDPVIDAYERVADRYGVPSINAALAVDRELRTTGVPTRAWFRDVVHTTPEGAARTAALVADAVSELVAMPPDDGHVPAALHGDHLGRGRVVLAADAWRGDPEEVTWQTFRLTYRYLDLDRSQALSFESSAALKGLFVVVGPRASTVRVSTASGSIVCEQRDAWTDYERISTVIFDQSLPAHTPIRVEHASDGDLKIIGFLVVPGADIPAADRVSVVRR